MAVKSTDRVKYVQGLVPQSLNGNATGRYYPIANYRRVAAVCIGGAATAGKKMKVEILQATDAAGSGAKVVTSCSAEAVAGTKDVACTLTLATVLNGEAVTINGLTFTGHTNTTTKSSRQFSIAGNDTADAAELVACINDPQYGVPGVFASSNAAVVTLVPSGGAKGVPITVTNPAGTITLAPTQLLAIAELRVEALDLAGGFVYVAAKVTTDAAILTGTVLVLGGSKWSPSQAAGATAAV